MAPTPAPTFGKRLMTPQRLASSEERTTRWRGTVAPRAVEPGDADRGAKSRIVPNSLSAGILTAVMVGALHMVSHLHDHAVASGQLGSINVSGHQVSTVPLILLGSLWAGGEAGFSSAFIVHGVLRRLKRTGFTDYAIGGGAVALLGAWLSLSLGLRSPDEGWPLEVIIGTLAGLLYRQFAGTTSVD